MIYVLTHKPFDEKYAGFLPSRVLFLGSAEKPDQSWLGDDSGDSISEKNSFYSELTGIYWLWKNAEEKPGDIIGIEHYRRFFDLKMPEGFTGSELEQQLSLYDIILAEHISLECSVKEHYDVCHNLSDLIMAEQIIGELSPESLPAYYDVISGCSFYPFNMLICRKELFDNYCSWLFPILFELEKRIDFSKYYGTYQRRVIGFIAERLLSVWVKYRNLKVKEYPVLMAEQEKKSKMFLQKECNSDVYFRWPGVTPEKKTLFICREVVSQQYVPDEKYDVIIAVNVIERDEPNRVLSVLKNYLSTGGHLLLYCDNRLGLKYFTGEKDPFTCRFGDGLENYIDANIGQMRNYSLNEIKHFLHSAGFCDVKTFSVFPDISFPQFYISESYKTNEKMSIRMQPEYNFADTVFLNEEQLLDSVIQNDMLPQMADGLFFDASEQSFSSDISEVVFSADRGKENSMITVIRAGDTVEKIPMYPEGSYKIKELCKNHEYLQCRGIKTVKGRASSGTAGRLSYVMPYNHSVLANEYLHNLFYEDREMFIAEVDRFRECILNASEIIEERGHVQVSAFPDMVPLNCFVDHGEYVFFDQEFCFENYPADAIILRTIFIIYELDLKMELRLPKSFFYERYGLLDEFDRWVKLCSRFTDELIEKNTASLKKHEVVVKNRERMNYSEELFEKLMYNPVAGLEGKELVIYGTGDAAAKFIEMYQRDFPIKAVVSDVNDSPAAFAGYEVISLDVLLKEPQESYRVIICSEDYNYALWKLSSKGFGDIAVYRPEKVYPGRQACRLYYENRDKSYPKKYHIGYIAGVFDLYHLGHLNMFRRAKEQCDYLIVGVVTDGGVRDFKKTEPFIPFDERVEMVRSCRYVDEVVEIPYYNRGTIEAFEKYHFDVQFSGSDYESNELWLYHKKWLNDHGADMVFLPYTAQTSSSKIKELINKSLV